MFQKMKKSKGFTLIEMLVVIAIIAVLVAIIIPVVGNSTTKAKAATDAANLRSAKASLTIAVMTNSGVEGVTAGTGKTDYTSVVSGATAFECKTYPDETLKYDVDANGNIKVYFGSAAHDIAHFADIAEG